MPLIPNAEGTPHTQGEEVPPDPIRGGAHIPFNMEAQRASTLLLNLHNLVAITNFSFVNGDCMFDAIEFLTGIPSSVIRRAAVNQLKDDVAHGDRAAVTTVRNIVTATEHGRGNLTFASTPPPWL